MSTPPNFQYSYDWSRNYLNNPNSNNGKPSGTSIFLIVFLLVVASAWWWIFYGSSWNRRPEKTSTVPLAGLDDLKKSVTQGKVTMTVKPNGSVTVI